MKESHKKKLQKTEIKQKQPSHQYPHELKSILQPRHKIRG